MWRAGVLTEVGGAKGDLGRRSRRCSERGGDLELRLDLSPVPRRERDLYRWDHDCSLCLLMDIASY